MYKIVKKRDKKIVSKMINDLYNILYPVGEDKKYDIKPKKVTE